MARSAHRIVASPERPIAVQPGLLGTPVTAAVRPRILISNGFSRFHLANLAAGLRERDWDVELLTGAYPSGPAGDGLLRLAGHRSEKGGRFLDRRVKIEPDRVHADFVSELVQKTGLFLGSKGAVRIGTACEVAAFRLASLRAARTVRKAHHVDAYHFRSGFALGSLDAARRRGIPTICDHSITHPAVLEPLVQNGGRLPGGWSPTQPRGIWRLVQRDIESADWILVNSDFVRETFEWAGFDMARVKVIYLGVEMEFMDAIPQRSADTGEGPLRLLFAGEIGQRKGADVLFRALSTLNEVDWTLDLAGPITPAIAAGWSAFLSDPRVTAHGTVRIRKLAALMSHAEVFAFPSLAEGSARVVAMAMAAGCYVITTPNSGSVVQQGIHGDLVRPGDHLALAAALRNSAEQRTALPLIGRMNAELIRREYLIQHYVDRVISFYNEVLKADPSAA